MARMKTGDQEKIRQFKQEIQDVKKDLKDTFADIEEPEPEKNSPVRIIIIAAVVTLIVLAAVGYLILSSGII